MDPALYDLVDTFVLSEPTGSRGTLRPENPQDAAAAHVMMPDLSKLECNEYRCFLYTIGVELDLDAQLLAALRRTRD